MNIWNCEKLRFLVLYVETLDKLQLQKAGKRKHEKNYTPLTSWNRDTLVSVLSSASSKVT